MRTDHYVIWRWACANGLNEQILSDDMQYFIPEDIRHMFRWGNPKTDNKYRFGRRIELHPTDQSGAGMTLEFKP